ncbi:AAA family ATPase [Desulfococcaceae bacterium HSG7]|nr:AAA family ATPase [Desulfococcaceae bacterium HSG9]MDM8554008.1 AAA family ATPase [Desulfococcaceae bacterium HSG7]
MKIKLKNLGPLQQAELELGDFTIICGKNNTGKTYATYAAYGFFDFWNKGYKLPLAKESVNQLFSKGKVTLNLPLYAKKAKKFISQACKEYTAILFKVFAAKESLFKGVNFSAEFNIKDEYLTESIEFQAGSAEQSLLQITKEPDSHKLIISLMVDKNDLDDIPSERIIRTVIGDTVKDLLFKKHIPRVFIASAERTGSAIFQKELDFTRNRLVEFLGEKSSDFHPIKLLGKFSSEYPIPVRRNVDFIRELSSIANKDSFIYTKHLGILNNFNKIAGGEYKVKKNGDVQYAPNSNKRLRLSMVESSSAVRSLLDIGFYLRHIAKPGDMLIVDEPELNLHPENQRRIARLFVRLVNIGIKVFITTHSDYIIKELNTLIMLNKKSDYTNRIADQEKYDENEFISPAKLKVFIAEDRLVLKKGNKRKTWCMSLTSADINPELGIEVKSFDTTIDDMNRIQEALVWGDE